MGGIRRDSALADEGRVVAEVVVGVGAASAPACQVTPPSTEKRGGVNCAPTTRSACRSASCRRPAASPVRSALCGTRGSRAAHGSCARRPHSATRLRRSRPRRGRAAGGDADPVDRRAATEAARARSPGGRRKRRCRQDRREHEDPPPHPGIQAATDSLPAPLFAPTRRAPPRAARGSAHRSRRGAACSTCDCLARPAR